MRRLGMVWWRAISAISDIHVDSVTRSPLYSIYGETIAGVTIIRSFGASSKFLRDMLACVDTVSCACWCGVNTDVMFIELESLLLDVGRWIYPISQQCLIIEIWFTVNRWLSIRFNVLSCSIIGLMAVVAVANPGISASLAGFSLAFASTITGDLLFLVGVIPIAILHWFILSKQVRRFVSLDGSMVSLSKYIDLRASEWSGCLGTSKRILGTEARSTRVYRAETSSFLAV